jgi:hypothetical protein
MWSGFVERTSSAMLPVGKLNSEPVGRLEKQADFYIKIHHCVGSNIVEVNK